MVQVLHKSTIKPKCGYALLSTLRLQNRPSFTKCDAPQMLHTAPVELSSREPALSREQTCAEASRGALRLLQRNAWCKLTTYICFFMRWNKPHTDLHAQSTLLWWTDIADGLGRAPHWGRLHRAMWLARIFTLVQHASLFPVLNPTYSTKNPHQTCTENLFPFAVWSEAAKPLAYYSYYWIKHTKTTICTSFGKILGISKPTELLKPGSTRTSDGSYPQRGSQTVDKSNSSLDNYAPSRQQHKPSISLLDSNGMAIIHQTHPSIFGLHNRNER